MAVDPEVAGWSKTWQQVWLSLVSFALVAAAAGIVAALVFLWNPRVRRRWLPLQRLRWGEWSGGEVLLGFFFWIFAQYLVMNLLREANFFWMIYGREPEPVRTYIWQGPFVLPLVLALIFPALYLSSGTFPSDLGLSGVRWQANLLLGCAGFTLIALPVLLLHALVSGLGGPQQPHPFGKLAAGQTAWWEWVLCFFAVCVAAPINEEVLFRGILQGWLRRTNLLGHMVFMTTVWFWIMLLAQVPGENQQASFANIHWPRIAFAMVLIAAYTGVLQYLKQKKLFQSEADFLPPADPALAQNESDTGAENGNDREPPARIIFTPAQKEALARWHLQDKNQQWRKTGLAIFGSSLAFALSHPPWPDPIPLLALGLVLGWLAHRTQSLIPGMVLHSLFNLVTFVTLMLTQPTAANGNDATTALRPSVGGSTTSSVPASCAPRFK